ncbi:MAG: hypothetical protein ACP5QG_03805, partial [candidate division WOR-3 bacterium]
LAMLGCSKDWPFERTENGKVEIEGGGGEEPEGGIAYPATIYGTISSPHDVVGSAKVIVWDNNGVEICNTWVEQVDEYGKPYNLCGCNMTTASPLPWTVCGTIYDPHYSECRHHTVTVTNLPDLYNCGGGLRRKAKQVNLNLFDFGDCDGSGCY